MERKKDNGRKSELLRDFNPQHSALYADALPTELRSSASKLMSIGCPYREHFSRQTDRQTDWILPYLRHVVAGVDTSAIGVDPAHLSLIVLEEVPCHGLDEALTFVLHK